MDRLDALLARFSLSAELFHSGPLCGLTDFAPAPGVGQLHLVKRGVVDVVHAGFAERIEQPSLLFYPRPLAHRFITDHSTGAELACANVRFGDNDRHPIALGLPNFVALPLAALEGAQAVLEVLFAEAFAPRCGGPQLINRLFEVVLIYILRALIDGGRVEQGVLAGLADARLCRALVAMHEDFAHPWSLETLAQCAGQSRTQFAQHFREVVGSTAGDYLTRHRLRIAQSLLLEGRSLDQVATAVGYSGQSALSRAFIATLGIAPSAWRAEQGLSRP